MRISFIAANFDALAELWNEVHPAKYRMDAELMRMNTVGSPVFDWGASGIEVINGEVVGFVSVKRSAATLYRGLDADQSHLSAIAFKDASIGVDLLADAKKILRNRGATRLVFGQDSRHFFPGLPSECRSLADFLMVEGFTEGGEQVDLERDLKEYANPFPRPDLELRPVTGEDIPALEAFLRREFPGRWTFDVMFKVLSEPDPSCVFALFDEGGVEGFALLQWDGSAAPIGGAVWRGDLGPSWGSLGPIGVSKNRRGRGEGNALLGAALENLRNRGTRQCIIDWTTLVDFYGGHGFQVSRTYKSYSLAFGD